MKAHLIDTHLLVPRSRSCTKVKVKYQGHVSQKMCVSGALLFHKHILFSNTYLNGLTKSFVHLIVNFIYGVWIFFFQIECICRGHFQIYKISNDGNYLAKTMFIRDVKKCHCLVKCDKLQEFVFFRHCKAPFSFDCLQRLFGVVCLKRG